LHLFASQLHHGCRLWPQARRLSPNEIPFSLGSEPPPNRWSRPDRRGFFLSGDLHCLAALQQSCYTTAGPDHPHTWRPGLREPRPHPLVGPFLLQELKDQAWRPNSLWVAVDQIFRSVALALDWMVWPGLPGRGGTTVGATLACHKPKLATIPCSAWISMGAIRELWGPDLCAIERGPAKVGTIARQ
jgi:hypothetical protein